MQVTCESSAANAGSYKVVVLVDGIGSASFSSYYYQADRTPSELCCHMPCMAILIVTVPMIAMQLQQGASSAPASGTCLWLQRWAGCTRAPGRRAPASTSTARRTGA